MGSNPGCLLNFSLLYLKFHVGTILQEFIFVFTFHLESFIGGQVFSGACLSCLQLIVAE